MASETVKKVLLAETNSDKKLYDARKKSEAIILSAEEYSKNFLQQQIEWAKADSIKLKEENLKKISKYQTELEANFKKDKEIIIQQVNKKMPDAINEVISTFFSN